MRKIILASMIIFATIPKIGIKTNIGMVAPMVDGWEWARINRYPYEWAWGKDKPLPVRINRYPYEWEWQG